MPRDLTLDDAIASLRREISDKQRALDILEQLAAGGSATVPESVERLTPGSAGQVAAEILRAAGRPMHWSREIYPAVRGRGVKIGVQALPTALRRHPEIKRVARGMFAHSSYVETEPQAPT